MKCKCSEVYVIEHGEFQNTKGDFVYLNKPANFRDIYLVWSITGKNVEQGVVVIVLLLFLIYKVMHLRYYRSSHWRCSVKKVFLKISKNSRKNTCARVSLSKRRHEHSSFLVNFAKFLRTPFLQSISGRLLLFLITVLRKWFCCPGDYLITKMLDTKIAKK